MSPLFPAPLTPRGPTPNPCSRRWTGRECYAGSGDVARPSPVAVVLLLTVSGLIAELVGQGQVAQVLSITATALGILQSGTATVRAISKRQPSVAVMLTTGVLLEARAAARARRELRLLITRTPRTARRHEGSVLIDIPFDTVVCGDRLLVGTGEVVRAADRMTIYFAPSPSPSPSPSLSSRRRAPGCRADPDGGRRPDCRRSGLEVARALLRQLQTETIPHERAEGELMYPAVVRALGGTDPLAALSRSHAEIEHLVAHFARLLGDVHDEPAEPEDIVEMRSVCYGLYAVLRLHIAQEEGAFGVLYDSPKELSSA